MLPTQHAALTSWDLSNMWAEMGILVINPLSLIFYSHLHESYFSSLIIPRYFWGITKEHWAAVDLGSDLYKVCAMMGSADILIISVILLLYCKALRHMLS